MINRLRSFDKASEVADIAVMLGVVMIVVMMIIPMPSWLLDVMLALSISLSLLVLLLSMSITNPLQISIFPTLLLILTLFRLALSVATTKLILLDGYAGEIVAAFGSFVIGGNYVVGFVIFLIIVVIQFIVITKGSERVSEVAARFTLDAMPGKQMSIDADLNAGMISDAEARQKRANIQRESDFYGSMDGASKFVKGDAIAGIIIVVIDFVGGLMIGMLQQDLSFMDSLTKFTLLTIGDGLVSQIPALLVSTGTGIIVTRASAQDNLGHSLRVQLFSNAKLLYVCAAILLGFGVVPGLPFIPFFVLSIIFAGLAYVQTAAKRVADDQATEELHQEELEAMKKPENVMSLLQVDQVELEIGYSLIPLVDTEQGGDMLDRITMIRRQCALELGMIVPVIRIRDNLQLNPNSYVVKIKGIEVGQGELMVRQYLAMDSGGVTKTIEGIKTKEPSFGLDALWIEEAQRESAELAGYTVVDSPSVLATHLSEVIKNHAHELLGRQEVQALIDGLKQEYSAVVSELVPNLMSIGEIQKVLQNLLREGIPVRNLVTILESLADAAPMSKDIDYLTEYVREALARQISRLYLDNDVLLLVTLDPHWEEIIASGMEQTDRGLYISLEPRLLQKLYTQINVAFAEGALSHPIILVSPTIRMALKRLTERSMPNLIVLSFNEISADTQVQAVGMVKWIDESEKISRE